MDRARTRHGERGWTVVEVLLVVIVVGLLLALAIPNLLVSRVRNNEAAAIRALGEIARAQALVRRSGFIDANGDGRGEYGFLAELSGEKNPRAPAGGREAAGSPPAPLPQFYLKVSPEGRGEISGYFYRVYLPGEGGRGVREVLGNPRERTTEPVDPVLAADTWCAYAWPAPEGPVAGAPSGERTFMVNQLGTVVGAPGGPPSGEPAPGAGFQGPGPAETITGAPALGTLGRDGRVWRVVR